ncbi:heavy-metal-associated domain-containing protein [Nocardioides sp. MAHUQ-72]|uniref:heavy-metal-associated domain-containing protein n=1 Tax=unclassified Nocardioides TaxID=2615069 RepID=UPI0036230CFC
MSTARTPRIYQVTGMTCGHCVTAVQQEVGAIDGVTAVTVDLATGSVTVTSTRPVADDQMTAAIDEAGYELVS